jgi:thioredoxin 1
MQTFREPVAEMHSRRIKTKIAVFSFFVWFFLSALTIYVWDVEAQEFSMVPARGMVTMIDLGADSCIPCKMMAPILEKLEKEYDGRAAIVFIDVWKHKDQAGRFGIRAIPTQIFFDKEGKEAYRHLGFMSEKAIVEQLKKMGVE